MRSSFLHYQKYQNIVLNITFGTGFIEFNGLWTVDSWKVLNLHGPAIGKIQEPKIHADLSASES
jgi:hypothetical protein